MTSRPATGTRVNALERMALEMASTLDLDAVLATITQGMVDELDAAFARIWLVGPGDLCDVCHKADTCFSRERCLHLKASAGIYTNLHGEYRRVPLGWLRMGRMRQGSGPLITNDIGEDHRLQANREWVEKTGLKSFVGYPLIFQGEVLGMMALFARREIQADEIERLGAFASQAAIAIGNARLFTEVQRLKDRLEAENAYLKEEIRTAHSFAGIVGTSAPLQRVLRQVEMVAPTDSTVLLTGETGTGKELVARAIHDLSPRRGRPLVRVNCAAIAPGVIESELFGHEKGAFTGAHRRREGRFELAEGGTIFLDEIAELSLDAQAKLLRVLQERETERVGGGKPVKLDVRVIGATNRSLEDAVRSGAFRSDLYYRVAVFPIEVPPLRERREDIPLLVSHFLERAGRNMGREFTGVSSSSMRALMEYSWPGNVRELQNVLERAAITTEGPVISISTELRPSLESTGHQPRSLREVETAHIRKVLEQTDWVVEGPAGAARILDMNPSTLRSRMKKLGLRRPR